MKLVFSTRLAKMKSGCSTRLVKTKLVFRMRLAKMKLVLGTRFSKIRMGFLPIKAKRSIMDAHELPCMAQ